MFIVCVTFISKTFAPKHLLIVLSDLYANFIQKVTLLL